MRNAGFNIWNYQSLFPFFEPLWAWPLRFLCRFLWKLIIVLLIFWHFGIFITRCVYILIDSFLFSITYILERSEPRVDRLYNFFDLLRDFLSHSVFLSVFFGWCFPLLNDRYLLFLDLTGILLVNNDLFLLLGLSPCFFRWDLLPCFLRIFDMFLFRILDLLILTRRNLLSSTLQGRLNLSLEVLSFELIKQCLILHQLDLQILIRLIMIGNEIIDGFE